MLDFLRKPGMDVESAIPYKFWMDPVSIQRWCGDTKEVCAMHHYPAFRLDLGDEIGGRLLVGMGLLVAMLTVCTLHVCRKEVDELYTCTSIHTDLISCLESVR